MSTIRGKIVFLLALVLTACGGPSPELPPVPEVDASQVSTAVRAQMEQARDALKKEPRDAGRNGHFAMVLHAYDRNEEAFVLYERARLLAPEDPRWPYYESGVLQQLGEFEKSLAALDEALAISSGHVDVMAKRGEALFLLNRLDEAEDQLGQVLRKSPRHPLARFYLARLHIERQEWEEAANKFGDLLSGGLNVRDVHQNLGLALRMLGRTDEASRHLAVNTGLFIKSLDPINMAIADLNVGDKPHLAKAGDLYARGEREQAIRELEIAVEKNPDSLAAHLHLIRFYAEQKNVDAAREHYEAVMKIEPTNATAHSSWALALSQSGQDEEALRAYRKAIQADPRDPKARIATADALTRLKRFDEALAELDEVQSIAPDDSNALHLRGNVLIALGRYSEALVPLEQVRRREDRNTPMVLRKIAIARYALGQIDIAKAQLDAAVALARKQNDARLVRYLEGERRKLAEVTSE